MKRLHVHVSVGNLDQAVRFYSTLFSTGPSIWKDDYAKWMLDDPCVNFAVSVAQSIAGISHLGIQVDDEAELAEVSTRLNRLGRPLVDERGATCCYATSDKLWVSDPEGVPWETFLTQGESPEYGHSDALTRLAQLSGQATAGCGCSSTECMPPSQNPGPPCCST